MKLSQKKQNHKIHQQNKETREQKRKWLSYTQENDYRQT